MGNLRIVWTIQAKESLKAIFDFYKLKSPQGAERLKHHILMSPKAILFSKQFQVDDINPKYRRIVVRDFKVLYKEDQNQIVVIDVISTKKSPDALRDV